MASFKKKKSGYEQGNFHPINKDKYHGSFPIHYRSSWEKKFMMYCDRKSFVVKWGSESVIVKYYDPTKKRQRRYFVDFNMTIREKDGTLQKYWVEIKPHSQTRPPVAGRKRQKTLIRENVEWERNKAKWTAAVKSAKARGIKFIILTEKDLLTS